MERLPTATEPVVLELEEEPVLSTSGTPVPSLISYPASSTSGDPIPPTIVHQVTSAISDPVSPSRNDSIPSTSGDAVPPKSDEIPPTSDDAIPPKSGEAVPPNSDEIIATSVCVVPPKIGDPIPTTLGDVPILSTIGEHVSSTSGEQLPLASAESPTPDERNIASSETDTAEEGGLNTDTTSSLSDDEFEQLAKRPRLNGQQVSSTSGEQVVSLQNALPIKSEERNYESSETDTANESSSSTDSTNSLHLCNVDRPEQPRKRLRLSNLKYDSTTSDPVSSTHGEVFSSVCVELQESEKENVSWLYIDSSDDIDTSTNSISSLSDDEHLQLSRDSVPSVNVNTGSAEMDESIPSSSGKSVRLKGGDPAPSTSKDPVPSMSGHPISLRCDEVIDYDREERPKMYSSLKRLLKDYIKPNKPPKERTSGDPVPSLSGQPISLRCDEDSDLDRKERLRTSLKRLLKEYEEPKKSPKKRTSGDQVPSTSGKSVQPKSDDPVPSKSGKSVPLKSRDPVPSTSGKSVQSESGDPVPSRSGKSVQPKNDDPVPSKSGKSVSLKSRVPVPAKSGKSVQPKSGDPIPSTSGKSVPPKSEDPVPSTSGKLVPLKRGNPIPSTSGKSFPLKSGDPVPSTSGQSIPLRYDIDSESDRIERQRTLRRLLDPNKPSNEGEKVRKSLHIPENNVDSCEESPDEEIHSNVEKTVRIMDGNALKLQVRETVVSSGVVIKESKINSENALWLKENSCEKVKKCTEDMVYLVDINDVLLINSHLQLYRNVLQRWERIYAKLLERIETAIELRKNLKIRLRAMASGRINLNEVDQIYDTIDNLNGILEYSEALLKTVMQRSDFLDKIKSKMKMMTDD